MAMAFFAPEKPKSDRGSAPPWKVLVVDDDPDVHAVTKVAVHNHQFESRRLQLLHAMSVKEAQTVLRAHDDVAVALIDVVMETETAGLDLVSWIRKDLGNRFTRLILRTGQPGYAPQTELISDFELDGYTEKSELSRTRLITTIVTALRGYKLVRSLEENRQNLAGLNNLFAFAVEQNTVGEFARTILVKLGALLGGPLEGLFVGYEERSSGHDLDHTHMTVLAATGSFSGQTSRTINEVSDKVAGDLLAECLSYRQICGGPEGAAWPLVSHNAVLGALYLDRPLAELVDLIGPEEVQLFLTNTSLAFHKAILHAHVHRLAYIDELTGLATFAAFSEEFANYNAEGRSMTLVYTDIQRFGYVLDGLADESTNQILKKTAKRLTDAFPDALSIARKEKDEFVLLLDSASGPCPADIASLIEAAFQRPVIFGDNQIHLHLRMGIVNTADNGHSLDHLVRYANIALNTVRRRGGGTYSVFTPEMQEEATERVRLAALLSDPEHKTEFLMYYQPIVTALDERLASLEGLLRFRIRGGDFMDTSKMVRAAEASGIILDIGAWVLRTAFSQMAQLDKRFANVSLNVNLSPIQVKSGRFHTDLRKALEVSGLAPQKVVFEVTEGVFVNNDPETLASLQSLRDQGSKVVIDDFGTGYSSLSYLRKLPVDGIKIDRSFIVNMDRDTDARAVVKAIVAVAHALDLDVTAEGVETESQHAILRDLGCSYLQGYLFSRPVRADDVVDLNGPPSGPDPIRSAAM